MTSASACWRRRISSIWAARRLRTSAARTSCTPSAAKKGWRDALKARGIKIEPEWFVDGGFMESDGYRSMKRLLTVRPRIDAVFAVNDPAAIGAMKAIWEAGPQGAR